MHTWQSACIYDCQHIHFRIYGYKPASTDVNKDTHLSRVFTHMYQNTLVKTHVSRMMYTSVSMHTRTYVSIRSHTCKSKSISIPAHLSIPLQMCESEPMCQSHFICVRTCRELCQNICMSAFMSEHKCQSECKHVRDHACQSTHTCYPEREAEAMGLS